MKHLQGLKYYGGKSAGANSGTGAWIASLLPYTKQSCYIEPFAGMLGVLLQRPPTNVEIANDINGDIVHWWLTVRNSPKEFAEAVYWTPQSRTVFENFRDQLAAGALEGIERAVALHVLLTQSFNACPNSRSAWAVRYNYNSCINARRNPTDHFLQLRERICNVRLENTCALKLIDRTRTIPEAVLYLDPPYYSSLRQKPS